MRIIVILIFCLQHFAALSQVSDATESDTMELSQPAVPGQQSPPLDETTIQDDATIKIQKEEVPLFLQKILQDEKFRGWESGGVFRNENSTMFKVKAMDAMHNRTYFFDGEGKLLRAE